jgi:hypothetical protein
VEDNIKRLKSRKCSINGLSPQLRRRTFSALAIFGHSKPMDEKNDILRSGHRS